MRTCGVPLHGDPGPVKQPHQFWVASTDPEPRFASPQIAIRVLCPNSAVLKNLLSHAGQERRSEE